MLLVAWEGARAVRAFGGATAVLCVVSWAGCGVCLMRL